MHGVLRMIRAVVPHLRRQGSGRIINLSSIAGRLAVPAERRLLGDEIRPGPSTALRLELAPFGIQVVLIEPGSIGTGFADKAQALARAITSNPASPYRALYRQDQRVAAAMRRREPGPEVVTRVIRQAMDAPLAEGPLPGRRPLLRPAGSPPGRSGLGPRAPAPVPDRAHQAQG